MQSHSRLGSRAKLGAQVLLFAAAMVSVVPSIAAPNTPNGTDFRAIYDQFVSAVRANDKNKIADLIAFPVSSWSVSQKNMVSETTIPNRAEFLAKYESLFTPSMRAHALKSKPQKISDDHYVIGWRDEDLEHSFEFENARSRGFRLTAYLIGPR